MGVGEAHVKNNPQGSGRMRKRLAPPDGETGCAVLATGSHLLVRAGDVPRWYPDEHGNQKLRAGGKGFLK